ncbi:hypothetical protein GYMLUDRAFT_48553 [Collybiopsis luxurians FD-317 M1]|uniref:Mannose-P-dolichol utilization defect 1 protein homolog n=1 Tax=Collybiopsis luxurians FD-317 M1 TaxID=944289 RepID=A0A0D0AVT3_9AGAR|nr:hypothetical protein GYMLUDRAFT_48553 [Collybiopsis luxurians FD-317 M1]
METVAEKLTIITKNLPRPIRDLGVSLLDEKCYTKLIEQLDFSDIKCVKLALSKGLGIAIVVGGSIVKVPQIAVILRTQDSTGLSLPSYVLETLSYLITLFYSYRNSFPFSTYGENFFLGIQDIVVSILTIVYGYSPNPSRRTGDTGLLTAFFVASISTLYSLSLESLAYLQFATLPLSLFSKLPQITANHQAKSTGQLSTFAVVSQILGCVARLFTTSTEVGDPVVQAGFALALILNLIIGIQMVMYWGNVPPVHKKVKVEEKEKVPPAPLEPVDETLTQDYFLSNGRQRRSRPMQRVDHAEGSNRKWERKVD